MGHENEEVAGKRGPREVSGMGVQGSMKKKCLKILYSNLMFCMLLKLMDKLKNVSLVHTVLKVNTFKN